MIDVTLATPLPTGVRIEYDLRLIDTQSERGIREWAPHLLYEGASLPAFAIAESHHRLMHGSCRRPHYDGPDGLVRADTWLAERHDQPEQWPAWMLMTGDQVYADDVAGPMLVAIHELIRCLGLFDESFEGATIAESSALHGTDAHYYARQSLLPDVRGTAVLRDRFFGGVRKPVFTSDNADNHLISFGEVIAMYLLVWSPTPWQLVEMTRPRLGEDDSRRFDAEKKVLEDFVEGLPAASRLLAHLPTLMIFDDHDITDDWNLTAEWEQAAYGHPFSRRVIGNALLAYLLCQAWGNDPDRVAEPMEDTAHLLENAAQQAGWLPANQHEAVIRRLLRFEGWEYQVPGSPLLIVLDTRTRRWRSERSPSKPSGLMDWEALSELQQQILGATSVVIVSPAPMFGVKLIEVIQRLFTLTGRSLMVDAENWMAHRGTANVMLNIFRHSRTPGHYVILSGDVHYSFVYDIRIRTRREGPRLWQITSSGFKNAFPDTLLNWLDRANRWLYAPKSPLNWFTKRRPMAIHPRDPDRGSAGERLWNGPGVGLVDLDARGCPIAIRQLDARGFDVIFPPSEDEDA
ncbi:alkaline phosphatase D family protein [Halomonas shantousis]